MLDYFLKISTKIRVRGKDSDSRAELDIVEKDGWNTA